MDSITIRKNRPVAIWLYIGAGMIIIQVLLGGITRLTGSGLSITEWQPILGTFPPMTDSAWQEAFNKYKEIGQFKHINSHFNLSDFKAIYFWEWLHRDWARLMGLVFIFPFIYFLIKKKINKSMIQPMIILFILGVLQGLIGWIMVKSGINPDDTKVDHLRLAAHFIAALILLCYVVWFALKLSVPERMFQYSQSLRKFNLWLLVLVSVQSVYGAFMAGSHAAMAALSWPSYNGSWVPDTLLSEGSFLNDITRNLLTIQFIHRNLAYIIAVLVVIYWFKLSRLPGTSIIGKLRHLLLIILSIQVILGVLTLLNSLSDHLLIYGILHQFFGMSLLLLLVVMFFFTRSSRE